MILSWLGFAISLWTGSKLFSVLLGGETFHYFEYQNQNTDGAWVGILIWILLCSITSKLRQQRERATFLALFVWCLSYGFSRVICFKNGCCSGIPTQMPWGVQYNWGSQASYWWVPVHPVQLYCAVHGVISAGLLSLFHRKASSIPLLALGLLYYSLGRGITDLFRADPKSHWFGEGTLTPHGGMMAFFIFFGGCLYAYHQHSKSLDIQENGSSLPQILSGNPLVLR